MSAFEKYADPLEIYKVKYLLFSFSQFYLSKVTTISVWFIYCQTFSMHF